MADPHKIKTGGKKKVVTIMFSDIENFTHYSSKMEPDDIHRLLNEYFEAMTEIVFKYQGTVDKFMGDGLMAFFGDPEPLTDHALQCVRAAFEMQLKVPEMRQKWEKRNHFPLRIRIGINTGEVVIGNMGSSKRLSYTAIGADVNLAQRFESLASTDGILISRKTYDLIRDNPEGIQFSSKSVKAKGYDDEITVYEWIVDNSGQEILEQ